MNRCLFIAFVLCITGTQPLSAQPRIHFDSSVIDLGLLPHGERLNRTITYTNIGDEPLVIHRLWGADGGMVFGFDSDTVQPGKQGQIQVSCITEHRAGYTFRRRLQVYSNAGEFFIPVVASVSQVDTGSIRSSEYIKADK